MLKEIKNFFKESVNYFKLIFIFVAFFMSSYFISIFAEFYKINLKVLENNLYIKIISLLILILISLLMYRKDLFDDWKIFKKTYKEDLHLGFTYWFVALIVMVSSNFLLSKAGLSMPSNEASVRDMLVGSPFLSTLIIVILSPLLEELIFRQSFYKAFNNKTVFIIISSFLFGAMHITAGFKSFYEFFFLIPYMAMGFAFAFTMYKTKSLYPSVIIHIFHNFLLAFLSFLMSGVIL